MSNIKVVRNLNGSCGFISVESVVDVTKSNLGVKM